MSMFRKRHDPLYDLDMLWIGHVAYPPAKPGGEVHCHAWHEFVLVTQGSYTVATEQGLLTASPGQGFIYQAGYNHRPMPKHGRCRIYVLQWRGAAEPLQPCTPVQDPDSQLAMLCEWIFRSYPPQEDDQHLKSLCWTLFMAAQNKQRKNPDAAENMAHYLRNAVHNDFTVAELADKMNMSERHINRIFRAAYGTTPIRYRTQYLAHRAVHLLVTTSDSVESIAHATGFSNAQSLGRVLQKQFKASPSKIRKKGILPEE